VHWDNSKLFAAAPQQIKLDVDTTLDAEQQKSNKSRRIGWFYGI
jgi:hypothetical protein